jgi:hypothetical protein
MKSPANLCSISRRFDSRRDHGFFSAPHVPSVDRSLVQGGPSFPHPVEVSIDVSKG